MTDDNCSDCDLAHQLHIREDGIYGCPRDTSVSDSLCQLCREPMNLHTTTSTCLGRYVSTMQDTFSDSSMRSESPDPLLLAPDKQLPQQHYLALRRSAQLDDVVVPLRRSSSRRRTRELVAPYSRRSSLKMAEDLIRYSRPRRMSLQDSQRSYGPSYENEAASPTQSYPPRPSKGLHPNILNRVVPVEDMDPIEGFQPFTELDPRQLPGPVTIREPMRDLAKPPFEYVWNPTVVVPEVGGMRVRVGQFERQGYPAGDAIHLASSSTAYAYESEKNCSSSSGSEGYFTAQDWSSSSGAPEHHPSVHERPSVDTLLHSASPPRPQPEFIQGSSKSELPLQKHVLSDCSPMDTCPPSAGSEFPRFEALARHYAVVKNQSNSVAPQQPPPPPRHAMEPVPSAPAFASRPESPHALSRPPRRSSMPGTLPGVTTTGSRSDSTPSTPDRAITELAVDDVEDWATREPWEYIHRVLTSSTRPLVMFLKTPTGDIPAAAIGALGADLHLQKMLVDNEHWLLIGPRDVNLYEFGVRFQTRAGTQDKFVIRFGNLNWGADVNQIEDEVIKAVMEDSGRGRGTLPAQFMAGAMGGLVVWYALSLM